METTKSTGEKKINKYIFCVITRVGEKCFYDEFAQKIKGVQKLVIGHKELDVKRPYHQVKAYPFQVGELLILNADSKREIAFPERKPSKWGEDYDFKKKLKWKNNLKELEDSIDFRYFKDFDKAVRFCKKVTNKFLLE
jgi:hypothetical protein